MEVGRTDVASRRVSRAAFHTTCWECFKMILEGCVAGNNCLKQLKSHLVMCDVKVILGKPVCYNGSQQSSRPLQLGDQVVGLGAGRSSFPRYRQIRQPESCLPSRVARAWRWWRPAQELLRSRSRCILPGPIKTTINIKSLEGEAYQRQL